MAWRPLPGDRAEASNSDRKRAMQRIVVSGTPVGILAYQEKQPVAWCSIAPRQSYRTLGGEEYGDVVEKDVWSLVCFFVPRDLAAMGSGNNCCKKR